MFNARKTVPIYSLYPPTDLSVKIKLTESGLCFSGYTAFVSNHYERPFTFEDIEHRPVDHGYCFKKTMCYERPDLADKVRHTIGPYEAKDLVRNLGPNPKWEHMKVPTLKALFVAKIAQNPDLLDALLKTAPHRLIEASWDSLWGGGLSDHQNMMTKPGMDLTSLVIWLRPTGTRNLRDERLMFLMSIS